MHNNIYFKMQLLIIFIICLSELMYTFTCIYIKIALIAEKPKFVVLSSV